MKPSPLPGDAALFISFPALFSLARGRTAWTGRASEQVTAVRALRHAGFTGGVCWPADSYLNHGKEELPITRMVMDPWSVSSDTLDQLASQFFAASIVPYLGFLYHLSRPETKCPPLADFGFRFLLVFVFATIPAGIYAKVHFHDILANIDWLHGSSESLLTVTNLLIVMGMRGAFRKTSGVTNSSSSISSGKVRANFILSFLVAAPLLGLSLHPEPSNALSFPTWIIHISSVIEWLVAMSLVYDYAEVSKNPQWRNLTWAMIPLHTSGLCACTYHFFYNVPAVNGLVALQAVLTFFGNATLWAATYAIYQYGKTNETMKVIPGKQGEAEVELLGFEDLAESFKDDLAPVFVAKLMAISAIGAAIVKWGELWLNAPFQPTYTVALAMIFVPTGLNILKWFNKSRS